MVHKHSTVVEAYTVLGIEQGASLEIVKSTYKQLALKTHPDKNPDDANATAQFQKVSEAYDVLVKHLDRSAAPTSHGHMHAHHCHPFGYYEDDYDDDDMYYEDYDDYDEDYEERMEFYMFIFEELMRGRASRYSHAQYHRSHPHHYHHLHQDETPAESDEQFAARLRRAREEQEQAEERRAREEARRKAAQEEERKQERRDAEQRQRFKASTKKAKAEASRKSAEQKACVLQEKLQTLRSKVFAAARRKDAVTVKQGIWEENVDAAGGEIRKGSEGFVKNTPADAKETLLHIAAKNGDVDLVEWLDSHSADPDERNANDMTAFHIALQGGHVNIVNHFYETYSPKDQDYAAIYRRPESKSNLRIALDTKEPELAWLVLEKYLYTNQELDEARELVCSEKFKSSISPQVKCAEFINLFKTYGGYSDTNQTATKFESSPSVLIDTQTYPRHQNGKYPHAQRPRPTVTVEDARSHTTSPSHESPNTPSSASSSTRGRGHHSRRGSYIPRQQDTSASPVVEKGSPQLDAPAGRPPFQGHRGRGRGRGQGHFRGRGRERGQ